jgi:ferredoxin-thioredoxin reductase catalytic chain
MEELREIPPEEIDRLYDRMKKEAEAGGYHLNPDIAMTRSLLLGIIRNHDRYGYAACPCRLAAGDQQDDLDIVCPCDYRDADVVEYGTCY